MIIVGAGMAGLLAARMLRHHHPTILESQGNLPHNHSAVLRFGSSIIGDILGIEFRKVLLTKTALPWKNPVADALSYSYKMLGQYRTDRSVLLPDRWQSAERYIAPPDLIERMAEGADIKFQQKYGFTPGMPKVISTIPMPSLARIMNYERDLRFQWVGGSNILATVHKCDAYCSIMVPDPNVPFYRASITGDQLIVEMSLINGNDFGDQEPIAHQAARMLGLDQNSLRRITIKYQDYAKIVPIDEGERRQFIYWASALKGVAYQLGRYATWRPGLQLDSLVNDVRIIDKWIKSKSLNYDMEEHERKKVG